MFELKIGTDIDSVAALYREKWKEIVEDVMLREAWGELGMEPQAIAEVGRLSGVTDPTDPQFSAIYWAARGLPYATGKDRSILLEIIRQAKMISERRKSGVTVIK